MARRGGRSCVTRTSSATRESTLSFWRPSKINSACGIGHTLLISFREKRAVAIAPARPSCIDYLTTEYGIVLPARHEPSLIVATVPRPLNDLSATGGRVAKNVEDLVTVFGHDPKVAIPQSLNSKQLIITAVPGPLDKLSAISQRCTGDIEYQAAMLRN